MRLEGSKIDALCHKSEVSDALALGLTLTITLTLTLTLALALALTLISR